jgi:AraC family transcriptional regulator, regulatory protein of adaptative response / DNA-3-methyladenine glycosylase II
VGVRQGVALLGEDPRQAEELSQAWRPWRSYAQMHLWSSLSSADQTRQPEEK